ncbi:MAG: DUF1269 domain-containing protein [Steroidobacteraceae bacterium]
MNKMLAVVFGDEKSAYEGVRALSALDQEGSIDVNQLAVIKKNADGTVSRERVDDEFPFWTLGGTALGSVIGILGGPVGVAIGIGAGALAGLVGDLYNSEVDTDFLTNVSTALTPGKYAVVADVDEDWVTPVDTRMEALGGVVFRVVKSAAEKERRAREAAARRAELDQLKAEHAKAQSDRKAKLQAQIDHLRARIEKKLGQDQAQSKQSEEALQARVQALQKKADQEQGDAKAAIEARITRLRADYQRQQHA